ncbi:MAG: hypothetical protein ACK4RK_03465 [Gemmataceae bacterium]
MIRTKLPALLLFSALFFFFVPPTFAQLYAPYNRPSINPYSQPAVSPYLNLFNRGNPAINYYTLVRPEFQQRAFNVQFQSQLLDLERQTLAAPLRDDALPTLNGTGHPAEFVNYGNYYNFNSVFPARGGAAAPGAAPAGRSR